METTLGSKRQAWMHAIRLRTLPLALSSILMGSFLAAIQSHFRLVVFLLAALTTIFLQVLSNLANDYGDSIHGADSQSRQGPIRAVQSGIISLPEMKKAMILLALLSLASGLTLLYFSLDDWKLFIIFLGLGIAAIIAAITYTSGKKPYGYAGLGDISVFIFFGLLGVSGTYFLHTLSFDWINFIPAISLGLFSTAVLNINNIRDIESDTIAGKKSIPVRIGKDSAVAYNWFLIIGGNLLIICYAMINNASWALLPLITLPMMLKIGLGVARGKDAQSIDPFLKKMAISTLIWTISFGVGWYFFN
ncbi:1,4-dihydroxy-2-naphthoate polyprenyltransferase [Belliella kenyensis]|uniref:1,4-dihydroxy-2-naphthoate octaprenyltransferase n=1 Tax=Belliella kenyensis TaxID=1472724 RepID=A0ABV8EMF4_9BACT|nr:1,4-dihydroxy-2-naphthoate polyprenyltransferase [Belliella kenyensis]MCH7400572.1 1,4-dihydroxy-2-naphthoate polyprenyltransferase [Belliella kenyensis]MDN3602141.1 1,4-dihydroxy-2-naphthoate polyprenyltransferase [Belliella kenyensis]